MRIRPFLPLAALVFILTLSAKSSAQELRLTLDVGMSRPTGTDFDLYDYGYSVGANALFRITENLRIGGRIAYNRWGPDEAEFLNRIDPFDIVDPDVEGDAAILEVVPIVRLMTNYPFSPVNFFAQVGAGLYVLNLRTTITGSDGENQPLEWIFGEDSQYRFGTQLGAGFIFGSPDFLSVELYPMFHLIFNNGENTFKFFSINLGVGLGI